jgi:hypothetical protein
LATKKGVSEKKHLFCFTAQNQFYCSILQLNRFTKRASADLKLKAHFFSTGIVPIISFLLPSLYICIPIPNPLL